MSFYLVNQTDTLVNHTGREKKRKCSRKKEEMLSRKEGRKTKKREGLEHEIIWIAKWAVDMIDYVLAETSFE